MRAPVHFESTPEASRLTENTTAGATCSASAVLWDVGFVLAVFLGLALTVTAALTALGIG